MTGIFFVYDRTGKAIRKINRKGQSGEEYISLYTVTLDEENKEMFVNDILGKKIVVYDLYGNFKRSFKHKNGTDSQFYSDIFNYDRQHLICYDEYDKELPFVLISKQDGSITQEIKIPFKEKKFLSQIRKTGENNGRAVIGVGPGHYYSIFPFNDNWLLSELSSDTVYTFMPDYNLRPFIVRTPSIQSMNPEECLILRLFRIVIILWNQSKMYMTGMHKKDFQVSISYTIQKSYLFTGYTIYNGDFWQKMKSI